MAPRLARRLLYAITTESKQGGEDANETTANVLDASRVQDSAVRTEANPTISTVPTTNRMHRTSSRFILQSPNRSNSPPPPPACKSGWCLFVAASFEHSLGLETRMVAGVVDDHPPRVDEQPAEGGDEEHARIVVERHAPVRHIVGAGRTREPGHDGRADDRAEVADGVHQAGDRAGVAMADVQRCRPAGGHGAVLDHRRQTDEAEGEPEVGFGELQRDEEKTAAQEISDQPLQGAAPAPAEAVDHAIGAQSAQNAADAAEKQGHTRGRVQRPAFKL